MGIPWWFDSVKKCNSHLDFQVDRKMASHVTPGILPCCIFLVDGLRSNPTPPWRAKPTATRPGAVWQTRWRKAPHHSSGSKPTLAKGQFSSLSRDSRWFVYWNSGFRRSMSLPLHHSLPWTFLPVRICASRGGWKRRNGPAWVTQQVGWTDLNSEEETGQFLQGVLVDHAWLVDSPAQGIYRHT